MSGKKNMRFGSKGYLIQELANQGKTARQIYVELRPMVESQSEPMVYKRNPTRSEKLSGITHRIPKSLGAQLQDLRNDINRKLTLWGKADSTLDESEGLDQVEADERETEKTETEEKETKKPQAKGKRTIEDAKRFFLEEVRRIRKFCSDRELSGETIDHISMRPAQAAARLIPAGIPPEALLYSMVAHWPEDTRRDARIANFDFAKLSGEILNERNILLITRKDHDGNEYEEIPHRLFGYVLVLAEQRQPIMLIGPAGTGKSHLLKQLADFMAVDYGETPMTPGATRGDLLGRHTIRDFIISKFASIYSGGGIFNFEEIDASDASMLIVLNNALASNELYNSVNGEVYVKHSDFIAASTANTFGLGANRQYTGRERLDAATIDRWRMGRAFIDLDESVETEILGL